MGRVVEINVANDFGKDLGLMHELVVMGRKAGFNRGDWAKLAHNEAFMRSALDFIRRSDTSHFPAEMESDEKVERLAQLTKLVFQLVGSGIGCIACSPDGRPNDERGKEIASWLIPAYKKLGLVLKEGLEDRLLGAGIYCHQPISVLLPVVIEVLGVEPYPSTDNVWEWNWFRLEDNHFVMECLVVPAATSLHRIILFKEALGRLNMTLEIKLKFK